MNDEVDILDTDNLQLEGEFIDQVEDILSFIRLSTEKVFNLNLLFKDLERTFQNLAPGCSVEPFGSLVTGLGIRTSDVDCYVALPKGEQSNKSHVYRAKTLLSRYPNIYSDLIAITSAKVPIVKFFHIPTQSQCDVTFKSPAGVRNSKLISFILLWDDRALPLALLIKYWSRLQKFTGTNLMSSYSLTMMVIFFLQLKSILPPVYELQKDTASFNVEGWNTGFDETMTCNDPCNFDTLYELMGGFFDYYSTFNFKENVIAPFLGREISKKCFDNFELPQEYTLYKKRVTKDAGPKLNTDSFICIQDPFEHTRNCSLGIFKRLTDRLICHFEFASQMYEEEHPNSFLETIFTQDPNSLPNAPGMIPSKHSSSNKIKKQKKKAMHKMHNHYQNISKGKT